MHDVASALVERAIKSRTQDNVSCIVVDLRSGQL
jgi:serine/threonine protein phosphatase PrpC